MGAGKIKIAVETILSEIKHNNEYELIVICGNNKKLLSSLKSKYDDYEQISIISRTDKMPIYLKACDIFITKPGGLSSTEAALQVSQQYIFLLFQAVKKEMQIISIIKIGVFM